MTEKKYHCYICKERKGKECFDMDRSRSLGVCSFCKECGRKRPDHKKYLREYAKKYELDSKNKIKLLARKIIIKAIRDGILERKPCEVCANPKSEGHHEDYSKPLEVKWLCDLHHHRLHSNILN